MTKDYSEENHMVTPDPFEYERPPEPPFERDTTLVDTLRDITLSQQIDRIEDVIADLSELVISKRQA